MARLPVKIVLVSGDLSRAGLATILSKSIAPEAELWLMIVDKAATRDHVASALALGYLDREHQLMRPGMMPEHSPHAMLFNDGAWTHSRRRTFPPWALAEVSRLSGKLIAEQGAYLDRFMAAIVGGPSRVLDRVPRDFILRDEHGDAGFADPPRFSAVDLSGAPLLGDPERLNLTAQKDYRRDPYMSHLSEGDLRERAADVFVNLLEVGEDATVMLDHTRSDTWYWSVRFAELIAEFEGRYGPYPAGWKDLGKSIQMPGSLSHAAANPGDRAWRLVPSRRLSSTPLVKYGLEKWLAPGLREGRFRVSPASAYSDPSLDHARRDEELEVTVDADPFAMGGFGGLSPQLARTTPRRKRLSVRSGTDYYVYCLARSLSRRLFYDFGEVDACLLIQDPDEFMRRLRLGMREAYPEYEFTAGPVEYFDPLQTSVTQVGVPMWKHFRYAYQQEYRLAWVPPSQEPDLERVDLVLGSFEDICELVKPSKAP